MARRARDRERTVPSAALAAARGALERTFRGVGDFASRVYSKAGEDDIFFLAGGIAFNVLLAAIPFLLLLVSIFGYVLQATVDDPQAVVVAYVDRILPSARISEFTRDVVGQVIGERGRIGIMGLLLLVWVSTRMIGSLRSALRSVFNIREDRGIIAGKIFDAKMVIVAGTLFLANTVITVALEAVQTYGIEFLGLTDSGDVLALQALIARILAYGFILLMFVLIYRYLPARKVPWRIALAAATFTAVVFELLKSVFAWYVANIATYSTAYGTLAVGIILVLWIYYSAVVFVLGGEVGQVYELYRIRRRQRELLD